MRSRFEFERGRAQSAAMSIAASSELVDARLARHRSSPASSAATASSFSQRVSVLLCRQTRPPTSASMRNADTRSGCAATSERNRRSERGVHVGSQRRPGDALCNTAAEASVNNLFLLDSTYKKRIFCRPAEPGEQRLAAGDAMIRERLALSGDHAARGRAVSVAGEALSLAHLFGAAADRAHLSVRHGAGGGGVWSADRRSAVGAAHADQPAAARPAVPADGDLRPARDPARSARACSRSLPARWRAS